MLHFLLYWFHSLFPSLCIKALQNDPVSASLQEPGSLRCPVCGRLIAHTFPLHEQYEVHITHAFAFNKSWQDIIIRSLPAQYRQPVPKESIGVINWELLRDPIEPLISDTWDDDESYRQCIQEYIRQVRQSELSSTVSPVKPEEPDEQESE